MSLLPEAYQSEIQALNLQVLQARPSDILQFCADYFATRLVNQQAASRVTIGDTYSHTIHSAYPKQHNMANTYQSPFGENNNPFGGGAPGSNMMQRVIEEEENDTITSPTNRSFGPSSPSLFSGTFGGGDASSDQPPTTRSPPNPDSYPAQYNFARRTSVSAESLKPSADTYDNWTPPYHEKTAEQLDRLKRAIEGNFLFSHLEDEQSAQILGALVEKPIPAKGIKVISQGDAGDYFYVVEKGSFDVHVNPTGSLQAGIDGMGDKVGNIQAGGSFGELALMYNAPRAATVVSAESGCTVWALDRVTFRRILMESTFARRRIYESFLKEVPILSTLTPYERSKIADALETKKFPSGEVIIKEGDPGYAFYLLENGQAAAYKGDPSNKVLDYDKGDYFGELALLNDAPRAASVVATTDVKVASLGKNAFQRLLGPVEGIMRRTQYQGAESGVEEMDPLHTG
ncbi:protein kinase A regulatory subunit [Neonectria punicea]|uniref:cAMP-dependent protein kinase regulatory subunit n=1 Tax=Neonectria punicea TaxID=979145 RepID=A0ABR1HFG2_9HYPO